MPKIVDEAEQRRLIREAACRVFAERGLAGTGLTHVAAAAGMRRSNIYHYYTDKEALIRAMADELLAEEEALFASFLDGSDRPLERVERLAAALTGLIDHWTSVGRLLLQLWAHEPQRVQPFLRRVRERLSNTIREGQREGEIAAGLSPDLVAALIVGLLDGLLLQVFIDRSAFQDADALRRTLVTTVHRILEP